MRRQGHFHSYVSVLLQYRRAWWKEENPSLRRGFVVGLYSDGPLNYIQQASRTPQGRRTLRILLPDADRERAWGDAQIRNWCLAGLRDISSLSEKPIRSRITRWPEGLPCVGREEQAWKEKAKAIGKRLYLAGDRFAEWPSMNAAIVSGRRAAQLLSTKLGEAQLARLAGKGASRRQTSSLLPPGRLGNWHRRSPATGTGNSR
jgi:Flavin containing amine oxidoreductase